MCREERGKYYPHSEQQIEQKLLNHYLRNDYLKEEREKEQVGRKEKEGDIGRKTEREGFKGIDNKLTKRL